MKTSFVGFSASLELSHVERIRLAELELLRSFFRPGVRILELGGGSGFQAAVLQSWGCNVTSIDIAGRTWPRCFHPVQIYDGERIPFGDRMFDIVFSSNVLEHVKALSGLLSETQRVAKTEAMMIHVLPTSSWRLWTCVAHYAYFGRRALVRLRPSSSVVNRDVLAAGKLGEKPPIRVVIKRALIPAPHGEYSSALAELYYFSKRRWQQVFKDHGFRIEKTLEGNLFYSGRCLFPDLPHGVRKGLARLLGSSARVFVLSSGVK